MVCTQMYRCDC